MKSIAVASLLSLALFTLAASPAQGALVIYDSGNVAQGTYIPANDDLLQTNLVSATGETFLNGDTSVLFDGSNNYDTNAYAAYDVGGNLFLYLDDSFDIQSIAVLASWKAFRNGHTYTIAGSTDGGNTFTQFININQTVPEINISNVERYVIISDDEGNLFDDVNTLRFTFHGNLTGEAQNVYREIDVFGTAMPEPASLGFLLGGALLFLRRKR